MSQILLRGGSIVTGTADASPFVGDLLIRDDRIAEINAGPPEQLPAATVIDVSGMTIVPGLIDCHDHLALSGDPSGRLSGGDPRDEIALGMVTAAAKTVRAGFTTIRDLGGRSGVEFAVRDHIRNGQVPGPRLLLAGKIITITDSIADSLPGMFVEADSCGDLRRAARQQLKAGADVLKVMGSGALMAPGLEPWGPHFSREEYEVIVTEARREGKRVAVHAHGTASIRAALDAGVASIEHGTFLCDEPDLLRRMAGEGVFLVPTLSFLQRIIEAGTGGGVPGFMVERARMAAAKHARSFRMAVEHGVPIAFGTDTGSPGCRHGENADELRLMVRAGMTPVEALVAATSAAADCVGLADQVGTLEVGKSADIVVVNGDPAADIACLGDGIRVVVSRGRLVFSALDQQLPVVVS